MRGDVEALVTGLGGDRAFPCILAVIPEDAPGAGGFDKLACYVVYIRPGGFMVAAADTDFVRTFFSALQLPEGVEEAATHGGTVPLVLPRRGRAEGASVLLVDLPWAALEHFVRGPLPRSAAARAKVLQPSVGDSVGRPSTVESRSLADQWIAEVMDEDTAADYQTGAEGLDGLPLDPGDLENADSQMDVGPPEPALPEREGRSELTMLRRRLEQLEQQLDQQQSVPPLPRGNPKAPPTRAPGLFSQQQNQEALSSNQWTTLRNLAGSPPPRVAAAEQRRGVRSPAVIQQETQFAEIEKEVEEPDAQLLPDNLDPIQKLLFAQLEQNRILLQSMSGNKNIDPIQGALGSSDGASGSGSSTGVKGCMARDAFLKTVTDLGKVYRTIQSNAAAELGVTASRIDGSLLKKYMERRVPLSDHKLLSHFSMALAEGWFLAFQSGNEEMLGYLGKLLMFCEQVAIDGGRLQLAWLLTGLPDFSQHTQFAKKAPGLKPFSRLAHPSWVSANLAFLKDLDYLEARMQNTGRPADRVKTEVEQIVDPDPKPKPKRRPKKGGKGSQSQEEG